MDAVLDAEDWDPLKNDQHLEELTKSLEGKKQHGEDSKGGASAVPAKKVQDGAEPNRGRRKDKEQDKMAQAKKTLAGKKKHRGSSSSADDSDEEDEIFIGNRKDGDLLSRQRKLKKPSAENLGALLVKGFSHVTSHEQLDTLFGDQTGPGSSEQALQPGAVRYLLSSALPLMDVKRLLEERLREMRTLYTWRPAGKSQ